MEIDDFTFVWEPLPIVKFPHPILKTKTQAVTVYDEGLKTLVNRMLASMYLEPGCGLSANQVGVNKRLFVTDIDYRREEGQYYNLKPRVFINPRFKTRTGKQICKEGCLSFPGLVVEVERAKDVVLEFEGWDGTTRELAAEDFFADCLQHEHDHLEGITFLDRLSRLKQQMAMKKYLKTR